MSLSDRTLSILLAGAALVACGSITGGTAGSGPTGSQRSELALSLQDEVEAAVPSLTISAAGAPHGFPVIGGCPALGPSTDSDGDGIPDDQVRAFLDPPCTLAGFRGGTLGLTGAVRIQDPNGANNTAFNLTFTDLTWTFTDSAATRTYAEVRNGTRTRLGSTSAASIVTDLVTQRQRPGLATATVTLNTTSSFTAATPGTLLVGQPLPSGSFSVAGSFAWHRSTENWSLTVATVAPLQYDATCLTTPQRIKAGQITLTGTVNSQPGVLTVTWQSCGTEPARQWAATP